MVRHQTKNAGEVTMSWLNIIKHRPKDKEGNYISVKQEHANTIREWLENNKQNKYYDAIRFTFNQWEELDFPDGDEYDTLRLLARAAGYILYR